MKTHRKIISIAGPSLAVLAALPATAPAGTLLSGYGGPGQGDQAILGAALVNGPRGGGDGSGGANGSSGGPAASTRSGAGGQTTAPGHAATGAQTTASGHAATGGRGQHVASGATQGTAAHGSTQREDRQAPLRAASVYPASERGGVGRSSGALGLSAADLLYTILAFGALALTGVLTRRLTRTTAAGRRR